MREPTLVRHYQRRADSFYQAVQILDLDAAYGPAVGLLAIHSGIALADAVLVAGEGSRLKEDDHGLAAKALERLCVARGLDDAGIRHFKELLSQKTRFSYGEREVQDNEFKRAKMKMGQFFKWVYDTFPELSQTVAGDSP